MSDPRLAAIPDIHGHAKGEHRPYAEERPIPYTARMLFLWFYHACRRGAPRFLMVSDHVNLLTFEDPAAVNLVRRALKLAEAGDLYGAAETADVDVAQAAVVSEGLRRGMRYSIGAEIDNDPRSRPDMQNIVEAMRPDGLLRSVHFLPIEHPVHGAGWMWPFDNPEFVEFYDRVGVEQIWEIYIATLLETIEKQPGQIISHFYAPAKFGHWPDPAALEAYEDRFVAACAERGMAIEINTRSFYRPHDPDHVARYREANIRLARKAKEHGVAVAVGADAHSPRDQSGCFEEALSILDAAEINELTFPINGRLARVALRVTREVLESVATPRPAAAPSLNGEELHAPAPLAEPQPAKATSAPASAAKAAEHVHEHEPAPRREKRTAAKKAEPASDAKAAVKPPAEHEHEHEHERQHERVAPTRVAKTAAPKPSAPATAKHQTTATAKSAPAPKSTATAKTPAARAKTAAKTPARPAAKAKPAAKTTTAKSAAAAKAKPKATASKAPAKKKAAAKPAARPAKPAAKPAAKAKTAAAPVRKKAAAKTTAKKKKPTGRR